MEKKELNMKQFTATKTVKATPMTRTDAEKFLGRSITPADRRQKKVISCCTPTAITHGRPKKYSKELTDFQSLSPTACKSKRQNFATASRLSTRSL